MKVELDVIATLHGQKMKMRLVCLLPNLGIPSLFNFGGTHVPWMTPPLAFSVIAVLASNAKGPLKDP